MAWHALPDGSQPIIWAPKPPLGVVTLRTTSPSCDFAMLVWAFMLVNKATIAAGSRASNGASLEAEGLATGGFVTGVPAARRAAKSASAVGNMVIASEI